MKKNEKKEIKGIKEIKIEKEQVAEIVKDMRSCHGDIVTAMIGDCLHGDASYYDEADRISGKEFDEWRIMLHKADHENGHEYDVLVLPWIRTATFSEELREKLLEFLVGLVPEEVAKEGMTINVYSSEIKDGEFEFRPWMKLKMKGE